jgi:DNA-binding transcriptional regulator YiaG
MKKKHKKVVYLSFERYLAQQMKNKVFRKAYEEESQRLRIAYRILQLRKKQKLSQKELARKLNTTQSTVARMEAGQQNFTTDTLQKIASALDRDLKIEFVK